MLANHPKENGRPRWSIGLYALLILVILGIFVPGFAGPPDSAEHPEPPDWFAGDAHVHRGIGCSRSEEKEMLTPRELLEGMKANNLAVLSVLADIGNGEIKYQDKDIALINGKDNPASTPAKILHWDAEWHYDPKGVTFERKVIGGHLILLGLEQGGKPFSEYTFPIFAWARQQSAIAGFAHMQYLKDDIPQDLDCCAPLEYPVETALGSSAFVMEDVHGSDTAIQAYYRLLNCGFRPGLVAATDYPCNFLEPYGTLLTYVRIPDGKLTYRKWVDGVAGGHTVISRNGHKEFLDLKVNQTAVPGDEVQLSGKGTVQADICWSSVQPLSGRIELVRNGSVVASQQGEVSPGSPMTFHTVVEFAQSGWLCVRRMDEHGHQSHAGAVFVIVNRSPIRASAEDAEYFIQFIDNLIRRTSAGGPWNAYLAEDGEAARSRYRKAREIYRRIKAEAEQASGRVNGQVASRRFTRE